VLVVDRDYVCWHEARRAVWAADKNVGLAAVAKSVEHMGHGEQITLVVDEKGVAEERVTVAPRAGGIVKLIHKGTDRGGKGGVIGNVLGSGGGKQAQQQA